MELYAHKFMELEHFTTHGTFHNTPHCYRGDVGKTILEISTIVYQETSCLSPSSELSTTNGAAHYC